MAKKSDIKITGVQLFFIPIETRVPLKFGTETLTSVICARTHISVQSNENKLDSGWGETPLNVQWVWPSSISYQERLEALKCFCIHIVKQLRKSDLQGHALEIGYDFIQSDLETILNQFNKKDRVDLEPIPWLAALVCFSAFDIGIHDAYGKVNDVFVYSTYNSQWMNRSLDSYLTPSSHTPNINFLEKYPDHYILPQRKDKLKAWHLVGGLDPLDIESLTGHEPVDDYPTHLEEWIQTDGLDCLKIKLRGNDQVWDQKRLIEVGKIAHKHNTTWLTADFNCTVDKPEYVNEILDHLRDHHPKTYGKILYVEQPFDYELEKQKLNVRSLSARKPLFLDESAHDWAHVKLGFELGWSGVALKTCKTQTGAILSACWALEHGMTLMVQDLTNPMLAQIPHILLAAHFNTIMGVETNGMQFYPDASLIEAQVHPGIYRRRNGIVDLSTINGPGFGYKVDEMERVLPDPVSV